MESILPPLLFILFVLGATLEIISLFRRTEKVDFDYSISNTASEPNKPIEVITTITNKSILPISHLAINETFPKTAALPKDFKHDELYDGKHIKRICRIRSHSRKKMTLETSINKRGVYSFKADKVHIGDFLGFKELEKDVSTHKQIVIFPEKYESAKLIDALSSYNGDIVAKRYLIRDPIITMGLREYTGREPMREIHWPKSAGHGKLMVREFDYNRQLSVNVLLSVDSITHDEDDKADLDKCCSMARTICETLVAKGIPVTFFTNAHIIGKKKQAISKCEVSNKDMPGLLETLGRVTNLLNTPVEQLLEYTTRASDPASVSILIASKNAKDIDTPVNRYTATTGHEITLIKTDHPTTDNGQQEQKKVEAA